MAAYLSTTVMLLGLVVSLGSGWYIAKGPFFGFGTPPLPYILAATGLFVFGIIVFGWGLSSRIDAGRGDERVIPSNEKV
ncbi:hypothetical protein [Haloarchaeobius iranensis]|uniref:DUF8132 domain-containing protein n=1 Tax=Haloarchaeobius iranensis TaxID=996166 RepID=A0A1G9XNS7_9EURY|nr:hypothetical protein [Haloarchaeobius iranensis]SDM98424.1 hypothetical protein SAMN05192554_11160 [Haloarchaeobius iranensis]